MEFVERFGTEAEALAFSEGLEAAMNALDSDHLTIEPELGYDRRTKEHLVTYSHGC